MTGADTTPTDDRQKTLHRGDRLRRHLNTTDTLPGRLLNGAIVLLIFGSFAPCGFCAWCESSTTGFGLGKSPAPTA